MSTEIIKAETRTEFGKGAARRIRREDKIPAVIYGHGQDPIHLTMPGHETMMALRHGGANALVEIEYDGTKQLALTKAVQVDPVRRVLEHVDFVVVKRGEKVVVDIPVVVTGEAISGSVVVLETAAVQVEAEATHIPESVEVSVEGAEVGTQIHASDLTLPSGVTLLTEAEVLVVNVTEPRVEVEEDEAAEDEAAEGDVVPEGDDEAAEGGDEE